MKFLSILLALTFIACNSGKSENTNADVDSNGTSQSENVIENTELVSHPMIDNKGQVMGQMTFPANWKLHNEPGKAAFSGPNGVFVFHLPLKNFMYTTDPMQRDFYSQRNISMRQYLSPRAVIEQDFVPVAHSEGSKLIRIYDAPEIATADSRVQDLMYQIGERQTRYEAAVSEWEDKSGKPYTIIIHTNGSDMGNMVMWSYSGQILDAPKEQFKSATQTLIGGLASLEYNPRYFDQFNQNEMQRESASWAAHNQKMSAQQRNFDAQQSAYKQKTDAINSSIMASYNERNASSDRSHNRFLNYIKDENTVVNKTDGQRYQVQSGADQYWMNSDGQYIGTNDPNYDPNRNQGTQNQTWEEAEMTD